MVARRRIDDRQLATFKARQARISRRRLYPTTVFYSASSLTVLALALRSRHPWVAAAFYLAGLVFWTPIEYLSHRHVLHRSFPPGKGMVREFLHCRIDPLHWGHHDRPLDGSHTSGVLTDMLPLFLLLAPLSFITPIYTLPVCYAAFVEGYVIEEWLHHAMNFCDFSDPYSRYLKRHHLYHHSPRGKNLGHGITSGIWDYVFGTRYPQSVRRALSGGARASESPARRTGAPWEGALH